jgi:hypothetical protein
MRGSHAALSAGADMNPQELQSIQKAAGQIESALKALEDVLEHTNSHLIFKSSGGLVQALRFLHDFDGALLTPENRVRMDALAVAEKPKSGRNSFTTGF